MTKHVIADLMAQCVVDDLEVIEIEHHDAKWVLIATVCRQSELQAVIEQGAVWHSGQGIWEGLMREAQWFFVEQRPKPMYLLVIVADQPHDAGIGAGADHVEGRCQYLIGGPQFEGKGADELHCCIPPVQVMLGDGKDREPGCSSNPSLLADPVRFFLGGAFTANEPAPDQHDRELSNQSFALAEILGKNRIGLVDPLDPSLHEAQAGGETISERKAEGDRLG